MRNEASEEQIVRYLLGRLSEDDARAIEERVMRDDAFAEKVAMVESSLVDDYVEDRLAPVDREHFEPLLPATPQGLEQIRFTQALKAYASRDSERRPAGEAANILNLLRWQAPTWVLLAAGIVLAVGGIAIWRVFFSQSELDKGLSALNRAYEKERPTDARITVLSYGARPNARGSGQENADYLSLRVAELVLPKTAEKAPGYDSFHALGCLYLAKRDFDQAIEQFEASLVLAPGSARTYSDLGAAHFEKAKTMERVNAGERAEAEFSQALANLNRALELEPGFLPALFNRGLLYRETGRLSESADDWQEYLKKDPASPWADEARANIKVIENQK